MRNSCIFIVLLMLLLPAHVFASSVKIASGSHHQEFELFAMDNTDPISSFSISYESLSWTTGSLGRGWTHTFDTTLNNKNTVSNSLLQIDLFGEHYIFKLKGEKYVPAEWDHSTLLVEKNGAYIITRDGLTYSFDKNRQLAAIAGRFGEKITFSFSNGKMSNILLPKEKIITLEYGGGDRLERIIDPAGKAYTITYDNGGFPAAINYSDGSAWRFNNDVEGYMLTKTDRQGQTTTYTYDERHRTTSSINSKGKVTTVNYPDSNEREKTVQYNHRGEIHDFTYDAFAGTLTKEVDPKGGVNTYTHDKNGKTTSETDASGRTTTYAYDEHGQLTSMRDPNGNETTYKYDVHGNQIEITDPALGTIKSEYDTLGRLIKTTGQNNESTSYAYDTKGNLVSVAGPDGVTIPIPSVLPGGKP
jgi:YD repeat-containing protein